MCLLTFFPANRQPDEHALLRGAAVNDNGHGFAVVTGDRLVVGRGMNADDVIAEFVWERRRHPSGPALFHSRFATHGSVSEDNAHPFALGSDPATVVAHNGILPKAVHPGYGDLRSDTRIAAEEFLAQPAFTAFDHGKTRARITRWLGHANKLVILTVNPRYRKRAYLFNEAAGLWDNGIWYSNNDYEVRIPAQVPLLGGLGDGCVVCGGDDLDPGSGLCLYCEHCPFCGSGESDCPLYCYRMRGDMACPACGDFAVFCGCDIAPVNQMT
ncbi:hypothetical protein FPZ12_024090 [Amycolatopsis acidicola]|uniref:Glutamine amidotransferase type-2 domain-containing protein n=1 Tax=Amycolatopsis acidicola TaxID=2596893 RepID=A0A5N0UX64_9PSEU|nr:hypothetical protein [Amycolatopsis acidicola]KAA9157966.1 hypothetical protein FPZ12_024090 [Amycolatopsis acidicola]